MQRVCMTLVVFLALVAFSCGPKLVRDNETAVLWESYEEDSYWLAVGSSWGDRDLSKEATQTSAWATEGETSLAGTFELDGQEGATFYIDQPPENDWSEYKAIGLDVKNNTTETLKLATALCTGDIWAWHESLPVELEPGVNRNIRFDFYTNTLKSDASNWEYKANLVDAESVMRLVFRVYSDVAVDGSVYLDNVRLVK